MIIDDKNSQRTLLRDRIRPDRGREPFLGHGLQSDREGRSGILTCARSFEATTMGLHEALTDGKTQPQAAKLPSDGALALLEGIEDMIKIPGCDTDPRILDFQSKIALGIVSRSDKDRSAGRSKLHRVV